MHFCRICRTEKNLKYTVKELRKFSRKRCNDRLICTTAPTLGNICHECEERLHNFNRLEEEHGDGNDEERIIVDDDELLYNLFFEKMEQQRSMKNVITAGGSVAGVVNVDGVVGNNEWRTNILQGQTSVPAAPAVGNLRSDAVADRPIGGKPINDEVIEVLTSRENTPSPAILIAATPVNSFQGGTTVEPTAMCATYLDVATNGMPHYTSSDMNINNVTATNGFTSITNFTATPLSPPPLSPQPTHDLVANKTAINNGNAISPYKVVAVINLEDDDDDDDGVSQGITTATDVPPQPPPQPNDPTLLALTPPQTTPDSDEEEIVFRKVEEEDVRFVNKQRGKKKLARKRQYQNHQINLIASLSLVSSDNDSDIEMTDQEKSPITKPNQLSSPNNLTVELEGEDRVKNEVSTTNKSPTTTKPNRRSTTKTLLVKEDGKRVVSSTTQHSSPNTLKSSVDASDISSPNTSTTTSVSPRRTGMDECLDSSEKCPVCKSMFPAVQRLIQHMRRKHRSYDGDVLTERPRCSQDSAMTIRLRYRQRYNYYECQLCGCLDVVFKMHKEHVVQKHPIESRSLKDPMMQCLKCPICKEKCGMQHADLVRHMLSAHRAAERRAHLRQISHIRNLFANCNGNKKEKELLRTARIYQINKRKQYFFECLQCNKIISGYFNHVQHQNAHSKKESVKSKSKAKSAAVLGNSKKNVSTASASGCASSNTVSSTKATLAAPAATRRSQAGSTEKCERKTTEKPQALKVKELKDSGSNKRKPATLPQKGTAQKTVHQQPQSQRERKLSKKNLVKVKVKPPLKQLPTQIYNCNLCSESIKGFHRLNLHLLRDHAAPNANVTATPQDRDDNNVGDNEVNVGDNEHNVGSGEPSSERCFICHLRFAHRLQREQHELERHLSKQKRKATTPAPESAPTKKAASIAHTANEKQGAANGCNGLKRETHFGKNGIQIYKNSQTLLQTGAESHVKDDITPSKEEMLWLKDLMELSAKNENKQHNTQNMDPPNNMATYQHDADAAAEIKHQHTKEKNNEKEEELQGSMSSVEPCRYCGHLFNLTVELHSHEYQHVQQQEAKKLKRLSSDIFIPNSATSS